MKKEHIGDEIVVNQAYIVPGDLIWPVDITHIQVVRDRLNGVHAGYEFSYAASPEAAEIARESGSVMHFAS